jgi:hypothetical protein
MIQSVDQWRLLLFFSLSSLLAADLSHASSNTADALFEPQVKWDKSRVTVCWMDSDQQDRFTRAEKLAVQTIVQREFTSARTGIEFVGFKGCSDSEKYDIYIDGKSKREKVMSYFFFVDSPVIGSAEIGQGGIPAEPDDGYLGQRKSGPYRLYLYVDRAATIPGESYLFGLQFNALHEFGHMAGLRHEHIQREALADPNCSKRVQNDQFVEGEPIYTSTWKSSHYDPNSIMNYCWYDQLLANGRTWFHIRDLVAFQKSGHGPILELGSKMFEMPILKNTNSFRKTENWVAGVDRYQVSDGLSRSDLAAIRCMYRQFPSPGCQRYHPLGLQFNVQTR